ncbi:hypothetical protein AWV79_30450 [Cupriavidus sp. UYMMa02A]|nr:hypothetical protein AWV79_30450 [Cupriavidus sp. UYMMa02A]
MDEVLLAFSDASVRLVSVVGGPGVGKSRATFVAANRLRQRGGSVVHVPLGSAFDDAAREAIDKGLSLCQGLSGVPILFLDDCDLAKPILDELLQSDINFGGKDFPRILATSRARFHHDAETVIRVDPLPVLSERSKEAGPALLMFLSRVQALNRRVVLDESFVNRATRLLDQIDGLPFAIEIAAHHTALLGIESVETLLVQGVDLSMNGLNRSCNARHFSFESAWAWSVHTLAKPHCCVVRSVIFSSTPLSLEEIIVYGCEQGVELARVTEAAVELIEASVLKRVHWGLKPTYTISNMAKRFLLKHRVLDGGVEDLKFAANKAAHANLEKTAESAMAPALL